MNRLKFWIWTIRHLHSPSFAVGRMGRVFCPKCGSSYTANHKK